MNHIYIEYTAAPHEIKECVELRHEAVVYEKETGP